MCGRLRNCLIQQVLRLTADLFLARFPALKPHAAQLATAVQAGQVSQLIGKVPASARKAVTDTAAAAFTAGLDRILLVAAIIALASGVISLLAIRGKDFHREREPGEAS